MDQPRLTDAQIQEALDECAAEPVHIPGHIQPCAMLLAAELPSCEIIYASDNTSDGLGTEARALLGCSAPELLGAEVWHKITNAANTARSIEAAVPAGTHEIAGRVFDIAVFESAGHVVLELEAQTTDHESVGRSLSMLTYLTKHINTATDLKTLLASTTEILRHITGFDRVMVYKFDQDYNGIVEAEARTSVMEPWVGLRFPHWDIPAQARAIMARIPLRFIQDTEQVPVPLLARDATLPPLDMTLATSRGVSQVHMEYLRNVGVRATMTLTLLVDNRLWGIVSFHHREPTVPPARLREILTSFAGLFSYKIQALEQQAHLAMIHKVEALKVDAIHHINTDQELDRTFPVLASTTQDVLSSCGVALLQGSRSISDGRVPGQAMLETLLKQLSGKDADDIQVYQGLAAAFPDHASDLNGCAGALVVKTGQHSAFCVFREESLQSVHWAGNPEKTVETTPEGRVRLSPRGSFATYVETQRGLSDAWTDEDMFFGRQILTLMNMAERRVLMNTLDRQQKLMISELNHRVRNILALVRSVSKQARRRYGTLSSYAKSLEARIQALAAAHSLASAEPVSSLGVRTLIAQEIEPFVGEGNLRLSGTDRFIRADIAPIFSLIVHELATNAAKYGALSAADGHVTITLQDDEEGLSLLWQESGGPAVSPPTEKGFGSVLIEKAVPHELGGRSRLTFEPEGVQAQIYLPGSAFDVTRPLTLQPSPIREADTEAPAALPDLSGLEGACLVLEDNFIIAREMAEQLKDFGAAQVETLSNAQDALEFLQSARPPVSALDLNLGGGTTSLPVALRLRELGLPFFFVTGYGDNAEMPADLAGARKLSKPVSNQELLHTLSTLLPGTVTREA